MDEKTLRGQTLLLEQPGGEPVELTVGEELGFGGVDMFILLSGLGLYGSLVRRKDEPLRKYFLRRCGRAKRKENFFCQSLCVHWRKTPRKRIQLRGSTGKLQSLSRNRFRQGESRNLRFRLTPLFPLLR